MQILGQKYYNIFTNDLFQGRKSNEEAVVRRCLSYLLKTFANFTRKQLCWSVFLIKLQV